MLLEKDDSCLLLIDVQEKLTPYVRDAEALVKRCQWLMRLADDLGVPHIVSEQYPRGLGATVTALKELSTVENPCEKVHFSCWREPSFKNRLQDLHKNQLILIGIETHVCVLQTALDLLDQGFQVFVVVDAVSSRFELDYHYGLKRMKQAGAQLVTAEMVFFEWLERAGTAQFKALSAAYMKNQ